MRSFPLRNAEIKVNRRNSLAYNNIHARRARAAAYMLPALACAAFAGCLTPAPLFRSTPPNVGVSPPGVQIPPVDANALDVATGVASFYDGEFNGKKTSSGETFDEHKLTAAHRSFPFGTRVRVVNLENGKSCDVVINDRGPFVKNRIIDLSLGAAKQIGMAGAGTARVRLEVLKWGDRK